MDRVEHNSRLHDYFFSREKVETRLVSVVGRCTEHVLNRYKPFTRGKEVIRAGLTTTGANGEEKRAAGQPRNHRE